MADGDRTDHLKFSGAVTTDDNTTPVVMFSVTPAMLPENQRAKVTVEVLSTKDADGVGTSVSSEWIFSLDNDGGTTVTCPEESTGLTAVYSEAGVGPASVTPTQNGNNIDLAVVGASADDFSHAFWVDIKIAELTEVSTPP